MFAITGGWEEFVILVGAGIIGAIVLGTGRAVMGLVRSNQTKKRASELDQIRLSEFLFGVERDPRTGTPGREGWTVRVDKTLAELAKGLRQVIDEITPDHNGRHNLRGIVERGAEAAGAKIPPPLKPDDESRELGGEQ